MMRNPSVFKFITSRFVTALFFGLLLSPVLITAAEAQSSNANGNANGPGGNQGGGQGGGNAYGRDNNPGNARGGGPDGTCRGRGCWTPGGYYPGNPNPGGGGIGGGGGGNPWDPGGRFGPPTPPPPPPFGPEPQPPGTDPGTPTPRPPGTDPGTPKPNNPGPDAGDPSIGGGVFGPDVELAQSLLTRQVTCMVDPEDGSKQICQDSMNRKYRRKLITVNFGTTSKSSTNP